MISRRESIWLMAATAFSIATKAPADDPKPAQRSRREFADAMNKLEIGMHEADALRLLGKPDDIGTSKELKAEGHEIARMREFWRYGTSGHRSPATLGQVYIDVNGRVEHIFGKGSPPPDKMFSDDELRHLLDALGRVPSYEYNPRNLIVAVNSLQPLGKQKALAAIDEYLRIASSFDSDGQEVFLVLRTLFDVPNDPRYMPEMRIGAMSPKNLKDRTLLPRYPIALEGDIPFFVVTTIWGGGHPEPAAKHVDYFQKEGRIREKPLRPSDRPFQVLDEFAKSPRWNFTGESSIGRTDEEAGREFLGRQLVRMLSTVIPAEPEPQGKPKRSRRRRKQVAPPEITVEEAAQLNVRWDAESNKYMLVDGTSFPDR